MKIYMLIDEAIYNFTNFKSIYKLCGDELCVQFGNVNDTNKEKTIITLKSTDEQEMYFKYIMDILKHKSPNRNNVLFVNVDYLIDNKIEVCDLISND